MPARFVRERVSCATDIIQTLIGGRPATALRKQHAIVDDLRLGAGLATSSSTVVVECMRCAGCRCDRCVTETGAASAARDVALRVRDCAAAAVAALSGEPEPELQPEPEAS